MSASVFRSAALEARTRLPLVYGLTERLLNLPLEFFLRARTAKGSEPLFWFLALLLK